MNELQCKLPDITLSKPKGLSSRLFFRVYSGANAIGVAQLSSGTRNKHRRAVVPDQDQVPGASYCLKKIEVSQNYRNQGVGSTLLDEVIRFCKEERVAAIYGEAKGDENVSGLRRWYQDKGFDLDDVDNIQLSFPG